MDAIAPDCAAVQMPVVPRSAWERDLGIDPLEEWGPGPGLNWGGSLLDPAATVPERWASEVTWDAEGAGSDGEDLAGQLAQTAPGPALAQLLGAIDPARVSQSVLLAAIGAAARQHNHAQSLVHLLIAEADRRSGLGRVASQDLAAEISVRLAISPQAAENQIADAHWFRIAHPAIGQAMEQGLIDRGKATIIAREAEVAGRELPPEIVAEVARQLAAQAPGKTHGALRALARRKIGGLIPAQIEQARHEEARKERAVWVTPEFDGMATFSASLPAADALAAFTLIDRMAGKDGADDDRSRPQRRADAFAALTRALLDEGATPLGSLPTSQRGRPHLLIHVEAPASRPSRGGPRPGVPPSSLPGAPPGSPHSPPDSRPGSPLSPEPDSGRLEFTLEGYGPITAGAAASALAGARVTLAVKEAATGLIAGLRAVPESQTAAILAASHAGSHALSACLEDPAVSGIPPGADAARLADRGPPIGNALDWKASKIAAEWLFSGTYRPGASLIRLVLARDARCTFPTCRVPAFRCDLDHIEPFDPARPAGDQTTYWNLHAACRVHHELKTHAGWRVTMDRATGVIAWTSPSGLSWPSLPEYVS